MAANALNQIIIAESKANNAVESARSNCNQIIKNAEIFSQQLVSARISEAEDECKNIEFLNNNKIEEFRKQIDAECCKIKNQLQSAANLNFKTAAEAVLREIFGQQL